MPETPDKQIKLLLVPIVFSISPRLPDAVRPVRVLGRAIQPASVIAIRMRKDKGVQKRLKTINVWMNAGI